jgi:hypothetical protein
VETFRTAPRLHQLEAEAQESDGFFPFVRLRSNTGEVYPKADSSMAEITALHEQRQREREVRRQSTVLSPRRGPRFSSLSFEQFRTSLSNGVDQDRIERALEVGYLSRDPSPSRRAAYIRRKLTKARTWL